MLATTVAAEAALLPVSAWLFGRVTLAGLALNLVAIPLMSVLQAASMAGLAVSAVSIAVARATGFVAHLAATGILESARLTAFVPGLARDVATPAIWLVALYYACGGAFLWARLPGVRRGAAAAMALSAAVILIGPAWAADVLALPATGMRVVVLDVGQGDATAIVLPGGRAVLVDAGGVAGGDAAGQRGRRGRRLRCRPARRRAGAPRAGRPAARGAHDHPRRSRPHRRRAGRGARVPSRVDLGRRPGAAPHAAAGAQRSRGHARDPVAHRAGRRSDANGWGDDQRAASAAAGLGAPARPQRGLGRAGRADRRRLDRAARATSGWKGSAPSFRSWSRPAR